MGGVSARCSPACRPLHPTDPSHLLRPQPAPARRSALLSSVDVVPALAGKVSSGGRLNIAWALATVQQSYPPYLPPRQCEALALLQSSYRSVRPAVAGSPPRSPAPLYAACQALRGGRGGLRHRPPRRAAAPPPSPTSAPPPADSHVQSAGAYFQFKEIWNSAFRISTAGSAQACLDGCWASPWCYYVVAFGPYT